MNSQELKGLLLYNKAHRTIHATWKRLWVVQHKWIEAHNLETLTHGLVEQAGLRIWNHATFMLKRNVSRSVSGGCGGCISSRRRVHARRNL